MYSELTYKLTGPDAQIKAEESAYYQNKQWADHWRCRIGKITILNDQRINMNRYKKSHQAKIVQEHYRKRYGRVWK